MQQVDIDKILKNLDISFTIDLVNDVTIVDGTHDDKLTEALVQNGYKLEHHHDGTLVVRK